MHKLYALLLFCIPALCSCDTPVIDEEAIDDVWHQAKLRGVAFRAVGQEPGWLLEISEGSNMLLVTDYGANRLELPYVEPIVYQEEARTEYIHEDRGLVIELRGEACVDTMSGEAFSVSVTITRADSTLYGCGRALY